MLFNVACSIAVVFMGGAVEIYTFSNVGYLASFIPVLIGYYLLRKHRPNVRRPFKLPEWMKYVALGDRGVLRDHLLLRRPGVRELHVQRRRAQDAPVLLHRDRAVLLSYLLFYWYRKRVEDKRPAAARRRRSRRRPPPIAGASDP